MQRAEDSHDRLRGYAAALRRWAAAGGDLVMGLSLLVMALAGGIPVQVGAAFVAGTAQSMVLVTYITLRTAYSPDALLGRQPRVGAAVYLHKISRSHDRESAHHQAGTAA